jgi:hypothetical protein
MRSRSALSISISHDVPARFTDPSLAADCGGCAGEKCFTDASPPAAAGAGEYCAPGEGAAAAVAWPAGVGDGSGTPDRAAKSASNARSSARHFPMPLLADASMARSSRTTAQGPRVGGGARVAAAAHVLRGARLTSSRSSSAHACPRARAPCAIGTPTMPPQTHSTGCRRTCLF